MYIKFLVFTQKSLSEDQQFWLTAASVKAKQIARAPLNVNGYGRKSKFCHNWVQE